MNMITISREFGSGGRELGKRLADILGYDYYDREIIAAIAAQEGLDENYVETALDNNGWQTVPLSFRHTLTMVQPMQSMQTDLLIAQKRVMDGIVKAGRNCIIVGRNADVLLADQKPFNLFVCASMEARVKRCLERAAEGENLTARDMEKQIRRIDKGRARTREIVAGSIWGNRSAYHLTVNTTDWQIKELAPAVADYAKRWFERAK